MNSTPERLLVRAVCILSFVMSLAACGGEDAAPATPLATIPVEDLPASVGRAVVHAMGDADGVLDPTAVGLVSYTSHLWLDASLGCPQPGRVYAQAMTSGYIVKIIVDGKEREYRADMDGYVGRLASIVVGCAIIAERLTQRP